MQAAAAGVKRRLPHRPLLLLCRSIHPIIISTTQSGGRLAAPSDPSCCGVWGPPTLHVATHRLPPGRSQAVLAAPLVFGSCRCSRIIFSSMLGQAVDGKQQATGFDRCILLLCTICTHLVYRPSPAATAAKATDCCSTANVVDASMYAFATTSFCGFTGCTALKGLRTGVQRARDSIFGRPVCNRRQRITEYELRKATELPVSWPKPLSSARHGMITWQYAYMQSDCFWTGKAMRLAKQRCSRCHYQILPAWCLHVLLPLSCTDCDCCVLVQGEPDSQGTRNNEWVHTAALPRKLVVHIRQLLLEAGRATQRHTPSSTGGA